MAQLKPVKAVDASADEGSPDLEYIIAPIMYLDHGPTSALLGVHTFCIVSTRHASASFIYSV